MPDENENEQELDQLTKVKMVESEKIVDPDLP